MRQTRFLLASIFYLGLMLEFSVPHSSAFSGAQDSSLPERHTVCALSDAQQQAAPKAFNVMTPTFQHPRCMNCHGTVNPRTGMNHLGGARGLKEVIIHDDGGVLEPPSDRTVFRSDCNLCHNVFEWRTPERSLFFTGKDSVQLCRQMKRETRDAGAFMDHIAKDIPAGTPFIQVSFEGTRALNDWGKIVYEEYFYQKGIDKDFAIEKPPPFSHEAFVAEAQAWVDAMGGKFRGDEDCGCVPHHYTLSIDMQATQDSHVSDSVIHVEQSAHADIPLEFKDDGSLEMEGQMLWKVSGYTHMRRLDCTLKGSIDQKFKVKGTMDDQNKMLHLLFGNSTMGGSGTSSCSNGMNTTAPFGPFGAAGNVPDMPWDMPAFVGEDQNVPLPYQSFPGFTSTLKVRINQTD
jgi:hypothetical protein